ncbi:hypothetical protein ASL14_12860 [Paenibacillus sp. IHB B 3084]|uniref:hypothetical protein n=2 Tax=Paenibacillus TaxID=44249 RepID=UPI0007210A7F|nr:hypothetical protein [Paenibacillus terrae]ALP36925.1 hypothetical protein ASL14_12860 [Paenibacillus sp. IHB B 3084]
MLNKKNYCSFLCLYRWDILSILRIISALMSGGSIDEVKELFLAKVPGYDEILSAIRETLEVFEIQMREATIILGYDQQPVQIRFE